MIETNIVIILLCDSTTSLINLIIFIQFYFMMYADVITKNIKTLSNYSFKHVINALNFALLSSYYPPVHLTHTDTHAHAHIYYIALDFFIKKNSEPNF